MKKIPFLLLFFAAAALVGATELQIGFNAGTMNFSQTRITSETGFLPYHMPLGSTFILTNTVGDLDISTRFVHDSILRSQVSALFSYSGAFYSVSVGPLFGIANTKNMPVKPGIAAAIKFVLPGYFFVTLNSSRSINTLDVLLGSTASGTISVPGDYSQEANDLIAGFYSHENIITTVSLQSKIFSERVGDTTISDNQTDYRLDFDIFKKNSPFKVVLGMFYRSLSKSFISSTTTTYTLGALMLGTRLDIVFTERIALSLDADNAIFSFGLNSLAGNYASSPELHNHLFKAAILLKLNLDL